MNTSDIARQLGQLGGMANKQRHTTDHFAAIGRKGAATRWHSAMGSLVYFKTPLFDLVEQGRKTTTLRQRTNVKAGQPVTLACGRRYRNAVVDRVESISVEQFDDELVKSEGFVTKDELIKTLESFYPGETHFYLIRFHTL